MKTRDKYSCATLEQKMGVQPKMCQPNSKFCYETYALKPANLSKRHVWHFQWFPSKGPFIKRYRVHHLPSEWWNLIQTKSQWFELWRDNSQELECGNCTTVGHSPCILQDPWNLTWVVEMRYLLVRFGMYAFRCYFFYIYK